jgi:hypothetical protein
MPYFAGKNWGLPWYCWLELCPLYLQDLGYWQPPGIKLTSPLGFNRSSPVRLSRSRSLFAESLCELGWRSRGKQISRLPEMQMGDCGWVLGLLAICWLFFGQQSLGQFPQTFFPGPSSFILGESEQQKFKMTAQDEFFRHLVISSPIFFGTDVFSCLILSREKNRSGFFFSQVLSEPDLRKEFYQHEASSHRGFSAAEFGSSSKRISSGYLRR